MNESTATLTDHQVRRGLRLTIIAGCLGLSFFAVSQGVAITMLMEALQATGIQIGLVVTLQQLAMLVQIPVSLFTEKMSRRKPWWFAFALTHRILWLAPAVLPFAMDTSGGTIVWVLLGSIAASSLLAQAGVPLWFSWMADLVPQKISGRFWGVRQSVGMCFFLLTTAAAGWVLDLFPDPREGGTFIGFALVFGGAGLLGIVEIFLYQGVPEPPHRRAAGQPALLERLGAPLRNKDFRRLTLMMGLWTFAVGVSGSFGMVYLKRAFEVDYIHLALLAVGGSLGAVVAGFSLGRLIDRIGGRTVGIVCLMLAPLCALPWFFINQSTVTISLPGVQTLVLPQSIALLFAGSLVAGSLFSGVGLCQLSLIGSLSPSEGRTMAMAVHWTLVGAMASLGPVVGGWLMDYFTARPPSVRLPSGEPLTFFHVLLAVHMTAIWLCILFLRRVSVREGELALSDALGRVLVGNPLRALSAFNGMIAGSVRRVGVQAASAYRSMHARGEGASRSTGMSPGPDGEAPSDPTPGQGS